jgi:hypothetical protein
MANTSYSKYFHDITCGSNGYSAQTGYDLVTGLGSPHADQVVQGLVSYAGSAGPSRQASLPNATGLASRPARIRIDAIPVILQTSVSAPPGTLLGSDAGLLRLLAGTATAAPGVPGLPSSPALRSGSLPMEAVQGAKSLSQAALSSGRLAGGGENGFNSFAGLGSEDPIAIPDEEFLSPIEMDSAPESPAATPRGSAAEGETASLQWLPARAALFEQKHSARASRAETDSAQDVSLIDTSMAEAAAVAVGLALVGSGSWGGFAVEREKRRRRVP